MATKKTPVRRKRTVKKSNKLVLTFFAIAFGLVGVVVLKSSLAYSTELRISSIVGIPGNPTLTFWTSNHTLGTCNSWENLYFNVTGGISCPGNTIGNSVSDPVYLYAPQTYGNSTFSYWGGQCVATSGNRCTVYVPVGSSYDVYPVYTTPPPPPPPAPVVSLTVNPASIAYNGSTTVSWSATNNPSSCNNNFGASTGSSGSKVVSNLTASRSFTVTCTNGTSGSSTKSVTVAAQQPGGGGGGTGGGNTGGGTGGGNTGGSGGGSSGGSTAPRTTTPRTTPSPQAVAGDKTPPSTPANFQASVEEERPVVSLSWDGATDNVDIGRYQLERSTDQQSWKELTNSNLDTTYTDTDTGFKTHYFYRLRAFDSAGNASGYASVDVTTLAFKANITKADGGTLTHEDGTTVIIPANTISDDAACSLETSEQLALPVKGYEVVAGPYVIVCKTEAGNEPTFTGPLTASVAIDGSQTRKYTVLKVYVEKDGNWQEAGSNTHAITLDGAKQFAIYGKKKATPVWVKILILLLVVAGFGVAFLIFRWWRYRQQQTNVYDDYYRKSHGY